MVPLSGRADVYAKRCVWLKERAPWIIQLLRTHLLEPAAGQE